MNILNPVIIFSVFSLDRSYGENRQAHDKTLNLLNKNDIHFKELDGFYNGTNETSILINDTIENRTLVNQIAMKYNQESILLLDSNRHATLSKVINGVSIPLGPLESSKDRPDVKNYSYCPLTDTFFYVRGNP